VPKEKESNVEIKYRNANGFVIPYIVMELKTNQIDGVFLGPRNCNDESVNKMRKYLKNVEISTIVEKSNILI